MACTEAPASGADTVAIAAGAITGDIAADRIVPIAGAATGLIGGPTVRTDTIGARVITVDAAVIVEAGVAVAARYAC